MSRARKKKGEMNGNSLVLLLLQVGLPRNGAEASWRAEAEWSGSPSGRRSGVDSRPDPKWSRNPSGVPTPRNINWASCRKPRPPATRAVSALSSAGKVLYSSLLAPGARAGQRHPGGADAAEARAEVQRIRWMRRTRSCAARTHV